MKITLDTNDDVRDVTPVNDEYATATGTCPRCGASELRISGDGRRREGHDTYVADATAACCKQRVGLIRAKVETFFGLEEDEAMLVNGRARVY